MDSHPDSPDSLPGDQLTVDLLSSRSKRRRILINDVRRGPATDITNKNNNNDVDFVLMDDERHENGEDEVRIYFKGYPVSIRVAQTPTLDLFIGGNPTLLKIVGQKWIYGGNVVYTLREGFLVYLGRLSNLPA